MVGVLDVLSAHLLSLVACCRAGRKGTSLNPMLLTPEMMEREWNHCFSQVGTCHLALATVGAALPAEPLAAVLRGTHVSACYSGALSEEHLFPR